MALHYSAKREKPGCSRKIIWQMLALIPALAIAVACYSVSVYAWFQASIVNSGNVIQATTYDVVVTITDDSDKKVEAATDGGYHLTGGKKYKVILTAEGGGEKGGYCVIQPGDGVLLYTDPIVPTQSLTFTLIPEEEQTYTFTAVWGEYTGNGKIIENEATVGTVPTTSVTEQAAPTDGTGSSEPAETTAPEQPTTSQPTESTTNPAETTTAVPPDSSESTTEVSSAVTSEPQSSEPAVPDTTSGQTADTEATAPAASEPSDSDLIQTEREPVESFETE